MVECLDTNSNDNDHADYDSSPNRDADVDAFVHGEFDANGDFNTYDHADSDFHAGTSVGVSRMHVCEKLPMSNIADTIATLRDLTPEERLKLDEIRTGTIEVQIGGEEIKLLRRDLIARRVRAKLTVGGEKT